MSSETHRAAQEKATDLSCQLRDLAGERGGREEVQWVGVEPGQGHRPAAGRVDLSCLYLDPDPHGQAPQQFDAGLCGGSPSGPLTGCTLPLGPPSHLCLHGPSWACS